MIKQLFTIGYSSYTPESFLYTIREHGITAVVDVRSIPYSRFKPEFNRERLQNSLRVGNIVYAFLGNHCGERVDDPSCHVNGKVDYGLVAKSQKFKEGINRIKNGMKNFSIALMCAEKDPITCHRTILVCRNLISPGIRIRHILSNGKIEEHKDSEYRLMIIHKLDYRYDSRSEQQRLDDAYSLQGEKMAYKVPTNG